MDQLDKKCRNAPRNCSRMREAIRLKHYSMRTEAACVAWTEPYRQKQLANALDISPRRS
jgi:hypothetical protein